MKIPAAAKVRVPGTTANCGPGFDALGMACTVYNELELVLSEQGNLEIEVEGEGRQIIPRDERNIAFQAVGRVLERVGLRHKFQGVRISMRNNIPLARGLGSSAAAIVAGLVAANAATGNQLEAGEVLNLAAELEGHPDNVAPALLGGITVSVMSGGRAQTLRFQPPDGLALVVAVPEFVLPTKTARQALPQSVPFQDAVFNVSRTGLLVGALCTGQLDYLRLALEDRLHQPYRQRLIPGMRDVFAAALEDGALGVAISGAGPSLVAFSSGKAEAIGTAMVEAFQRHKIKASYTVLNVDKEGARLM